MKSIRIHWLRWSALVPFALCLALSAFLTARPARAANPSEAAAVSPSGAPGPIDQRDFLPARRFKPAEAAEWLSPIRKTRFAYDELIYSWSVRLPEGQGFRLYLRAGFADGHFTPWVYAGFWGQVPRVANREKPSFEEGRMEFDQLLLERKADRYQFKVVSEGPAALSVLPALHVLYTDNAPDAKAWKRYRPWTAKKAASSDLIFDLPLNAQTDSKGEYMPSRCQSAALSTAIEFFGRKYHLEDIVAYTHDPEYRMEGIWPRTIGAGVELGFDVYIDRFRNWDQVRRALEQNKVILCSITMPKDGQYIDPPYSSMGGHIVALNGLAADGRVVVTDSALIRGNRGYLCQWLPEDFAQIWMKNKGGVGMVVCPPKGFRPRLVSQLAGFPKNRTGKHGSE